MTKQEYKSHTEKWFEGKEGTANEPIKNLGGYLIDKGEAIEIRQKVGGGLFNIKSKTTGVFIMGVRCEKINLNN